MKATAGARVQVIGAWRAHLDGLAASLTSDADRLAALSALEALKSSIAAAQAEVTAAYTASQRATAARDERPHTDRVDITGHAIKAAIGQARRLSPHQAAAAVGLAVTLVNEMPHTLAALRQGRLNEWRATLLARETAVLAREHRAQVDQTLCGEPGRIDGWGDRQITREAAALGYQLDPHAAVNRRALAESQRHITLRPAPDQMGRLSALLPLRDAVGVWKALNATADTARCAGDERSRSQIMADTLTAHVLDGYAAGRVDPTRWSNVAQPAPRVPNLPIRLHLTMTDHTLLTGTGIAWLAGEPVTAGTADELLTAASVELRRVFADPAGRLVAMESASRYFPDGLADLIRLRDRHCQTPWCDAPIREIDHITPWTNGGPTTYTNGQGLCTRCNHAKQAEQARRGEPDARATWVEPADDRAVMPLSPSRRVTATMRLPYPTARGAHKTLRRRGARPGQRQALNLRVPSQSGSRRHRLRNPRPRWMRPARMSQRRIRAPGRLRC